jgi:hypothetical protein
LLKSRGLWERAIQKFKTDETDDEEVEACQQVDKPYSVKRER